MKSLLLEKINKLDKLLAKLTKRRRGKTLISKIRDEKGVITIGISEIWRIIRDDFENLYLNKSQNLDDIDKFLDMYYLSMLNQEDIENINRPI